MFLFGCLTRRGPRQADSSRDNFFICENCRQIDFQDLYDNPILNKEDQLSGPGYPLKFTPFCALCCLLELTPETNGKLELRSWLFSSTHSDWASTKVPGAKTSVCLRTYPFSATDSPQQIPTTRNISQVFFMSYGTYMEGPGVLKPQAVQCTPDYAAARSWLKNCQQHHGSECNHLRPVVDGLCFIDCTSRTIVEASKNSRWIALSYVWGKQPNLWEHREDAHVGAHLSNDVPQTIEDAITVTQELGYQYLWVDEYCINQKTNHREDQISKMDQIYHQADLTIVAAAGDNRSYGLPGVGTRQRSMCKVIHLNDMVILDVGPDPRTAARLSSWASRGWTFQESILSTRSLLFTDHQMSFHCEKASWMEALGGPKYLVEPQHIDWNLWPIFQALFDFLKRKGHARWVRFMIIASNYSYRHLTDDTDVLNAISGALKHIGHSRSPVYNLSGLPFHDYPRDTKSDTLGYCVAIALSWYHKIVFYVPQRISMFPSWTWAGWKGKIEWMQMSSILTHECLVQTSTLSNVQLRSSQGQPFQEDDWPHWSRQDFYQIFQNRLNDLKCIIFDAPAITASLVSVSSSTDSSSFTLVGRRLANHFDKSIDMPPPYILKRLKPEILANNWSCLLTCTVSGSKGIFRFVLVVKWLDKDTTERIGGFMLYSTPEEEENLGPFETSLRQQHVRLV